MPRVSVILTTYNKPRYLRQAIESVMRQTFTDWELIIVNDASPHPEAKKIISEFTDSRIRYFENPENLGNAKSANRGIREATGEYVARVDDDDAWVSTEKLQRQVSFLDDHSDYVLLGSNIIVADFDTDTQQYRTSYPLSDAEIRAVFYRYSPFAHSSILFRREVAQGVGLYDEDLRRIEDYDLWMRLGQWGKMMNMEECLVCWRSPSRLFKNIPTLRLSDHRVKLRILWRNRRGYPNFWSSFIIEVLKTFPYFLAACMHAGRPRSSPLPPTTP